MADSTTALINGLLRYTNLEDFKNALVGVLNRGVLPQGEYEPVVTGLVNLDDVALISAWYIDFGDFVKVDLSFEAQFSTGENQGEFNITFPNDANPSKVHLVCGTGLISLRIDVNGLVQIETGTGDTQRFDFTVTYKKA
jgi:hypothetical protein